MKRVAINIFVNGINYTSNYDEISDELLKELEDIIKEAVSNELKYLRFKSGSNSMYFPKYILKRSVISLIYD